MNVSLNMHHMFNKEFSLVDEICDQDKLVEQRFNPNTLSDQPAKKTLKVKSMIPINFGVDRKVLLEQACLDADYEPTAKLKKAAMERDKELAEKRGYISVYGYCHPKAL